MLSPETQSQELKTLLLELSHSPDHYQIQFGVQCGSVWGRNMFISNDFCMILVWFVGDFSPLELDSTPFEAQLYGLANEIKKFTIKFELLSTLGKLILDLNSITVADP